MKSITVAFLMRLQPPQKPPANFKFSSRSPGYPCLTLIINFYRKYPKICFFCDEKMFMSELLTQHTFD